MLMNEMAKCATNISKLTPKYIVTNIDVVKINIELPIEYKKSLSINMAFE